jgi:hypothetical protein
MYVVCILELSSLSNKSKGDGLRHFAYQKEEKFYNGVTLDDIHGENKTNVNGIGGTDMPKHYKQKTKLG